MLDLAIIGHKEYTLYCDESDRRGKFFSNFYGGLIVGSNDIEFLEKEFNRVKTENNLHKEIKWQKVSKNYLKKYMIAMDHYFDLMGRNKFKTRIMFTQNANVPTNLTPDDHAEGYFKLYYQFIKHAFGFSRLTNSGTPIQLRLYFDKLPDTKEKREKFKGYLLGLNQSSVFKQAKLIIKRENIAELVSHDHSILQYLDVNLGAMSFRLNDKHKEKPASSSRRGKRTIAKEALYKHILSHIRSAHPNFNIGITSGINGNHDRHWTDDYRHWKFIPSQIRFEPSRTKK